jgi:hypothetical protein
MQTPNRWLMAGALLLWGAAGPAWAQQQDAPPGPFVVDVRLALPSFSTGEALAAPLGLRTDQLPSRGRGFEIGAHVYPLRGRRVALGLGATLLRTSGREAPGEDDLAVEPTIETRFSAVTPHLSLNFGGARGWSYISGGLSWSRRSTGDVDLDVADGTNLSGLHYGGGARWFFSSHVGFTFDLRFYRLPAQAADGVVPDQPGYTMFLGSAGLSFK